MKKMILNTLLFFTICTVMLSCEKESIALVENEVPETEVYDASSLNIEVKDGMLAFKNHEELAQTIAMFASMSTQNRITWGEQNQVKTLQIIADEISFAQNEFEAIYYEGIEVGLSLEELTKTGKPAMFCDLYHTYLERGVITQVQEKDGFYSYHLSLLSPGNVFIVNEHGFYLVGDNIWLRTNDFLVMKKYEGIDDFRILNNVKEGDEGITYFNLNNPNRITNEFYMDNIFGTHGTLGDPTWYYEDSHHRFKHYVRFKSTLSASLTTMDYEFYTEARAQIRPYWSWNKDKHWRSDNQYYPIDYINGSWSYFWKKKNRFTGFGEYFYNDLSGGGDSPFILNPPGTTNLLGAPLNPYGTKFLNSPYVFEIPVTVEQMNIHGFFPGISGTYHTNYNL